MYISASFLWRSKIVKTHLVTRQGLRFWSIELHLYETHCGVATVRTMRMYEPNVHKLDRVSYT